jgi:hypothetical protein
MPNDPTDTVLSLGNCSAVVETAADIRRFRVHSAVLSRRGRRRVGLRFEGPQGSITIELSLVTFWRFTAVFHERSISRRE